MKKYLYQVFYLSCLYSLFLGASAYASSSFAGAEAVNTSIVPIPMVRGISVPNALMLSDDEVHNYFTDVQVTITKPEDKEEDGNTQLIFEWPDSLSFFVDPRLEVGLALWGNPIPSAFPQLYRECKGYSESLNDNWTLYSWSLWYQKNKDKLAGQKVTIIHLDDHKDMMDPRLELTADGSMVDILSSRPVKLDDPETIKHAILTGAIGIGSFMTPFLYELTKSNQVEVRHLCHRFKPSSIEREVKEITFAGVLEDFPRLKTNRLRLILKDLPVGKDVRAKYHATYNIDELLVDVSAGPILLHYDLDYFNNRYDRDSDWETRPLIHNTTEAEIAGNFNAFIENFAARGLADRCEDVFVGYCPGFFPAEYWPLLKGLLDKTYIKG